MVGERALQLGAIRKVLFERRSKGAERSFEMVLGRYKAVAAKKRMRHDITIEVEARCIVKWIKINRRLVFRLRQYICMNEELGRGTR